MRKKTMVRLANNLYFRDCKKRQEVLKKKLSLKNKYSREL